TNDIKGSGAGTDDGFWISTFNDNGSGSFLTWQPGLGDGGSNAIDLHRGSTGAQLGVQQVRRVRANFGAFEFRIKYKTLAHGAFDAKAFSVFVQGYKNPEDPIGGVGGNGTTVNLPLSLDTWTTARIFVDVSDVDDGVFWDFGINFNTTTESVTLRIDSIFIYGVPSEFGTTTFEDPNDSDLVFVVPGQVPKAKVVADAGKFLKADGTWDDPPGGGSIAFNDLTDVDLTGALNNDLLYRSGGNWIDTAGLLTWDGSDLRATNIGGILEADLLDKSAAETISGLYEFTDRIDLRHALPRIRLDETDAAANNRIWELMANGGQLVFRVQNDATSAAVNFMTVDRTLNVIDDITLTATTIQAIGIFNVVGPVTATSYSGIAAADLLNKIAAETVSGDYTFTGASNVYNGINQTNLLDKTAPETISGAYIFTADLSIESTGPKLYVEETDSPVDEKTWVFLVTGEQFVLATSNDARTVTATIFSVPRTGNSPDQVTFDVPILATSFGGIASGDLVDKGATEIITGAWNFQNTSNVYNGINQTNLLDKSENEVLSGQLITDDSTTTRSGFRIPEGVAPSSPVDGDMWVTTSDIFARINGVSESLIGGGNVSNTGTPLNNQVAIWTNATTIEGVVGLTFDGSTLNVMGAITATSYSGINDENLLDKTATEIISGQNTHTGPVIFSDNTELRLGTGGDAVMDFNGT
ncbi:MAG: hypothetical protein V3S69_06325, partial [Dehalococcoidales bacterium]